MSALDERPTAGASRDLSGLRDGASAARQGRSREDVLFYAYTHIREPEPEIRPCACGHEVSVLDGCDDAAIREGMVIHQALREHRTWRAVHGL